jgi:Undecaprenyl-phosphate galactose phosphotransferase WbaP
MPILETDEEALPKAAIPKSAIPKAAIPKSAIPKSAIPKADLSQAATETPLQLDFRKTERYDRLHSVDRQSAEMLRTYCRVNSRLEETATRLANVSGWQNLVTSVPLLLADWLAVYASLRLAAYVAFWLFGNQLAQKHSNEMLLVSLVVLPLAHLAGLYPGLGLGSILEFRQLSRSIFAAALVFFGLGAFSFPAEGVLFAFMGLLAFAIGVPTASSLRFVLRELFKKFNWWGARIMLVSHPSTAVDLYQRMQWTLGQGYRPVGVFLDSEHYWDHVSELESKGIPTYDLRRASEVALEKRVAWVVVSACANRSKTPALDPLLSAIPNRIQLASENLDLGIWDHLFCLGATAGVRVGGACPSTFQLALKRVIDVVLTVAALVVFSPFWFTLCVLVRLSSRGSVFYSQERIGRGGKPFRALKFRTMQQNADRILEQYLDANPAARAEWEEKHKLIYDPRVTRIGSFLRATSLDEIPQLWNVLRGEMSLVGPRPIVDSPTYDAEYIRDYPDEFATYKTVRPGLTGLWQVRCRNSGVYDLRIYWDMYYIRNWNVWLDLYLIVRTVRTVLLREGAA